MNELKMEEMVNFCKQYGFIFQGSEIYGGLANTWDYGPLGARLKNNVKDDCGNNHQIYVPRIFDVPPKRRPFLVFYAERSAVFLHENSPPLDQIVFICNGRILCLNRNSE